MIACYIFFFYGGLATNYPVCIFAWVLLGMIAMLSGISCFFPLLQEILYNGMEPFYGDEIDENENEERRSAEMVALAGLVEPLEVNPAAGGVTTDDDGLDFLDDDLTDQLIERGHHS